MKNISFDLLKKLENYVPFDKDETESKKAIIHFLKTSTNCYDRSNKQGHVTAGAFVCDTNGNILLNHHVFTGMWFQFGGHSDGNSNSFEVAKREVFEECGISDFVFAEPEIFDASHQQIDARPEKQEPEHIHYDINFLFITNNQNFKISNESSDIKWVSLDEAKTLVSPEDIPMQRMLKKFEKKLKENK